MNVTYSLTLAAVDIFSNIQKHLRQSCKHFDPFIFDACSRGCEQWWIYWLQAPFSPYSLVKGTSKDHDRRWTQINWRPPHKDKQQPSCTLHEHKSPSIDVHRKASSHHALIQLHLQLQHNLDPLSHHAQP